MGKMPPHRRRSPFVTLGLWQLCVAILAVAASGCGTDSSVTTAPTQVKCQVTLATDASAIGPDGGAGSLTVTTTPECPWDATTATSWVSNLTPTSGQGNGTVAFRVAANPLPSARDADIVVNDNHLRVSQQPATCRYTLAPATLDVAAGGGVAAVSVAAMSGCAWTVTTDAPWIAIPPPNGGSGDGSVQLVVEANDRPSPRTATIDLGAERVVLTQAAATAGPAPCQITLTPSGQSIAATGGPASVTVGASAGCAWSATSTVPWASVTGGASGTGPGVVSVFVTPNGGPSRTGSITVSGQAFTLVQSAATPATCAYRITTGTTSFGDAGGTGAIAVATTTACAWTSVSDVPWVTITSGTTGAGDGSAAFVVAANTGPSRTGTITIAGQVVKVTQAAAPAPAPCTLTLNPTAVPVSDAGGPGTVDVAASASSCAWSVVSDVPWIAVTSGGGAGSGVVAYTVAANTGVARTGTLTIGSSIVTIAQAAAPAPPPCTYGITPSSVSVPFLGAPGTIAVATAAGCAWTAASAAPWIVITSTASGTGAGSLDYLVTPNIGGARTGTLMVAGQTVTVDQAAVLPTCSFAIAPTSVTLSGSNTTGTVAVTTTGGCAWNAVSNDGWITVTSGASGSGDGTVAFRVSKLPGKNTRTGTITIAGQTFTVTQKD